MPESKTLSNALYLCRWRNRMIRCLQATAKRRRSCSTRCISPPSSSFDTKSGHRRPNCALGRPAALCMAKAPKLRSAARLERARYARPAVHPRARPRLPPLTPRIATQTRADRKTTPPRRRMVSGLKLRVAAQRWRLSPRQPASRARKRMRSHGRPRHPRVNESSHRRSSTRHTSAPCTTRRCTRGKLATRRHVN